MSSSSSGSESGDDTGPTHPASGHDDFGMTDDDDSDQDSRQDRRLQGALSIEPNKRSPRDLAVILEAVKSIRDEFIMVLSDAVKMALCSRFTLEEFGVGDRIFDYGEVGDKLYLIQSGRVSLEVPRNPEIAERLDSPESVELVRLTCLDHGRTFGELALISENKVRAARATAVKRTLLMVLTADDYKWSVQQEQESFVCERVRFLRSVDRSVLEDAPETDLRAMAGHMRLESHIGNHTILEQGSEVDRVIFLKSGFCKVVRQLHPRFKKAFDDYAERGLPPPNPFAADPTNEGPSGELFKQCCDAEGNAGGDNVGEALGLDLGLGGRQALRKLMGKYNDCDDAGSKKSQTSCSLRRMARGKSIVSGGIALTDASASVAAAAGENDDNLVIVDLLHAGMSFGVMEMMEGFVFQSSVIANPWAEVYVMTKYDLIRNTAKTILHKFFCDYKARLSDERLMQRLKQKRRWNNYKRDLWDEIRDRKISNKMLSSIDRRTTTRRTGASNLSIEDYERVGAGEVLWDRRAQTPPKPAYSHKHGREHVFQVQCIRNAQDGGAPDVVVKHDERDASLVALEEKVLMTIATARFRDQGRRGSQQGEQPASSGVGTEEDEQKPQQSWATQVEQLPALGQLSNVAKDSRPTRADRRRSQKGSNVVQRVQELEEHANCAANEYLHQRKARIRPRPVRTSLMERGSVALALHSARANRIKTPRIPVIDEHGGAEEAE